MHDATKCSLAEENSKSGYLCRERSRRFLTSGNSLAQVQLQTNHFLEDQTHDTDLHPSVHIYVGQLCTWIITPEVLAHSSLENFHASSEMMPE